MTKRDLIKEASIALSSNKVRTGLTVLGIVVGISSVIILSAIGNGAKAEITKQIESNGSNLLTIANGAPRTLGGMGFARRGAVKTLTVDDYMAIKDIENIANSSPILNKSVQLIAGPNNSRPDVYGVYANYDKIKNLKISSGNFLTENDNTYFGKVAVLGSEVKKDLFKDEDPINQKVRIDGKVFNVIGVLQPKGGSGFGNEDNQVFIPFNTMQNTISGDRKYLNNIVVSADSVDNLYIVSGQINYILSEAHKIKEGKDPDFEIINQSDLVNSFSSITDTFTLLLSAIASISLFVGGIGIMNMMLTQVTERTKEIGLRKSLGAKNSDIKLQFLMEAIYITVFGGIIGIAFGGSVSLLIGALGLATQVTIYSVLLSFSVSVGIGIIFGLYPAGKASRLSPIQALKYE